MRVPSCDIAPVNGATTWSFIDKNGTVLRSGYTALSHSLVSNLWAAQNTSGKFEVFDDANKNVSALSGYESIDFPQTAEDKEIFQVKKDGKWGCINRNGDVIIPIEYEMISRNVKDAIAIMKDKKWGMVTADNQELIPMEYANVIMPSERNTKHYWVQKDDSLYYH